MLADSPDRRSGRPARALLLAALGAALAAAALGFWLLHDRGKVTPGPLKAQAGSRISAQRKVGETVVFGLPIAVNTGDEAAILERISIVHPPAGLRVLETHIAGPRRHFMSVVLLRKWPDGHLTDLHPVRGYTVAPVTQPAGERGAELVFVMRVEAPGRPRFRDVAVDYRVGGRRHHALLDNGLTVCAIPRGQPLAHDCPL